MQILKCLHWQKFTRGKVGGVVVVVVWKDQKWIYGGRHAQQQANYIYQETPIP